MHAKNGVISLDVINENNTNTLCILNSLTALFLSYHGAITAQAYTEGTVKINKYQETEKTTIQRNRSV
jgi:hypothetical protein